MNHPGVRILLVTGGPGVVEEARKTTKRGILAGPGNPPVVVDETADLDLAGREIVRGASFDNNLICTDEKEVFVVASVADDLLKAMVAHGGYLLAEHELKKTRAADLHRGAARRNSGQDQSQVDRSERRRHPRRDRCHRTPTTAGWWWPMCRSTTA